MTVLITIIRKIIDFLNVRGRGGFVNNSNSVASFNGNDEKNVGNLSAFVRGNGNIVSITSPFDTSKEDSKKVDDDPFLEKSGIKKTEEENGYKLGWVNLAKIETRLLEGWEHVVDDRDGKKLLSRYGESMLLKKKITP